MYKELVEMEIAKNKAILEQKKLTSFNNLQWIKPIAIEFANDFNFNIEFPESYRYVSFEMCCQIHKSSDTMIVIKVDTNLNILIDFYSMTINFYDNKKFKFFNQFQLIEILKQYCIDSLSIRFSE